MKIWHVQLFSLKYKNTHSCDKIKFEKSIGGNMSYRIMDIN